MQRVEISQVYFNRTRRLWSVRRFGKVVARVDKLCMVNCQMRVSEKMRATLIVTRKRTVHAWICGVVVESVPEDRPLVEIRYDPFALGYFFTKEGMKPVASSAVVLFTEAGRCFADVE